MKNKNTGKLGVILENDNEKKSELLIDISSLLGEHQDDEKDNKSYEGDNKNKLNIFSKKICLFLLVLSMSLMGLYFYEYNKTIKEKELQIYNLKVKQKIIINHYQKQINNITSK